MSNLQKVVTTFHIAPLVHRLGQNVDIRQVGKLRKKIVYFNSNENYC
jgi:hypothetical protein